MALKFDAGGVMEYLWSQLEKTPDGAHIRYTIEDVDALWWMGFVDTKKYPLTDWRALFEPYRQPDGAFVLSHGAFLALEHYRYTGEIKVPFNPALINEGKYTNVGLEELFELSVAPSSSMAHEEMHTYIEDFKKRHRAPDGLIKIDKGAKREIKELLDRHPSPLRNLELILDRMIEDGVDEKLAGELAVNETARATTEVARQVSQFSTAPTTSETQAKKLASLAKIKPARPATAAASGTPGTELKRIKRSRKGMRG